MLQVIFGIRHVTCDTGHVTCDTQGVVSIVKEIQVHIFNGLGVMMFLRFGGIGSLNELFNILINEQA